MTHSPRVRADVSSGARTTVGRAAAGETTGGGKEGNGADSWARGASAAAIVEMSSASRAADQGANGAGADVGLKMGRDWLVVFEPRATIRRNIAFAVSNA